MKKLPLLMWLIYSAFHSFGQTPTKLQNLTIALGTNATALPSSGKLGFVNLPLHPSITVGTDFELKKWKKQGLAQTAKLGYFYHRLAQHGLQIYSETSYRYYFSKRMHLNGNLGIGGLYSISDRDIFVLNEGQYEKKKLQGRMQLMAGANVGFNYRIYQGKGPYRLFFNYYFWIQAPFVKEYVPILPNTMLHLGVSLPISIKKCHE